jgi:hypothetical protein
MIYRVKPVYKGNLKMPPLLADALYIKVKIICTFQKWTVNCYIKIRFKAGLTVYRSKLTLFRPFVVLLPDLLLRLQFCSLGHS